VAVGLGLGLDLCTPHQCHCGSLVDARGLHSFVCRRAPGRSARHHAHNDLIACSFASAGVPSPKSPSGCSGLTGRDQMVSHSFRGKAASRCAGTSQYPALWLSHMSLKPPVRQGRQQKWRPLARR